MASEDSRDKPQTCADIPDGGGSPGGADARVRFCLSEDGLKLGISRYTRPGPGGAPLTRERIRESLARAGISQPPSEAALDKILRNIAEDKPVTGITLVRGKPAVESRDAFLEPMGDHGRPVFPGDIVALKHAPEKPEDGLTLDGRVLTPANRAPAKDLEVPRADNVALNPADDTVRAQVYGLAEVSPQRAVVRPLITLNENKTEARAVIMATDSLDRPVTAERLARALKVLRISRPLLRENAEQALTLARETGQPQQDVVLALGAPPKPGKDGWLELLIRSRDLVGTEAQGGRLDYRERGSHPSVEKGRQFARLHPPASGEEGLDLFDQPIAASSGQPLEITAGEGVTALEGGALFQAEVDGMVVVQGQVLSITDSVVVPGDVSLSSGNIRVDKGSVEVQGSVRDGFEVHSAGHVVVREVVESARVEAQGNVEVGGGILMSKGGLIRAGGHVTAQFATNARIQAEGDVVIGNEITHCAIRTQGQILAVKGKGIIQGGTLVCGKGLECNELGSPLGVATVVGVSIQADGDQAVLEERGAIKKELERIDASLGCADPRVILERTPPEKREAVLRLLRYRMKRWERFREITQILAEALRRRRQEFALAKIRVRRVAHPGVSIKIAGRTLTLTAPVERSSFHYDDQTREIVVGNL
ncbi:MAG: FapA family protein [Desulfovibrio aminophilus]|uniref:FapA family protein n=1 Tax=Desulfovibrio aminophilus TaxID=81425 RepID=UPI0039EB42EC